MTVIATMLRHYDRNYVITTKITSLTLAQAECNAVEES